MFDNQTPFGMSISGQDFSNFIKYQSISQVQSVSSLIAIGNPIVDITVNVDKDTIQNCGLEWGRTVFNNEITQKFLDSLDTKVIYLNEYIFLVSKNSLIFFSSFL